MSHQGNNHEEIQKIDIMTLVLDFLNVFKRMWGQVIFLGILFGTIAFVNSDMNYQEYYTAASTFTITIKSAQSGTTNSFFDNEAAGQMAKTFPRILTSSVLRRRVALDLGLQSVPGNIRAEATQDTNLFTLSVTDTDAKRAYDTLESVIENYPELSEVIVGRVNMNLLDTTGIPMKPDNPQNLVEDIVKGAMTGIVIGFCWVAFVTIRRKTIRREEDCPKHVNHRCLGVIPQIRFKERSRTEMRRINVLEKHATLEYLEGIQIVCNKLERSAKENKIKKIIVTSALPGEGKSTIAVNLALNLAQMGKRVALLDCDLRNPSDNYILGVKTEKGIVEYLKDEIALGEIVQNISKLGIDEPLRFFYLSAGTAVADGAVMLENDRMENIMSYVESKVDYMILDSAPVGILTDASVLAHHADGAIFVIKKDFANAEHILKSMEHLKESGIHIMGCVLNGD